MRLRAPNRSKLCINIKCIGINACILDYHVPQQKCRCIEHVINQIVINGDIATKTLKKLKCGTALLMDEALHKDKVRGELFHLLTLVHRCYEHHCHAGSAEQKVLFKRQSCKNWKIKKRIKSRIWTEQIHENLI